MHLSRLDIHGFRCIHRFEAGLPSGKILIVGDNACGKTTLLEAIYYLVTGRSFRTRADAEVIPWEGTPGDAALVRGTVCQNDGTTSLLSMAITSDTKAVRIDGQPIQRLAGLWGRLRAVLFTPDDLQLIKGEPGNRRRYLDVGMSQISPPFLHHLQRYLHALRQRNALLRRTDLGPSGIREQIEPWNAQLARHGAAVFQSRFDFIRTLEPRAARYYGQISSQSGTSQSGAGVPACESGPGVPVHQGSTGTLPVPPPSDPESPSQQIPNPPLTSGPESPTPPNPSTASSSNRQSLPDYANPANATDSPPSDPAYSASMPYATYSPNPQSARKPSEIIQNPQLAAPSPETLTLRYINFLRAPDPIPEDEAEAEFLRLLRENLEDDIRRGHTEIGPHRDDFTIRLGGKPVRDFGSQGQIRSAVLALRFAEMEEMEARTNEAPLLLLDDLASELDPSRKERVLQLLQPHWQTFLTTTRRTDFPPDSSFVKTIHLPESPAS